MPETWGKCTPWQLSTIEPPAFLSYRTEAWLFSITHTFIRNSWHPDFPLSLSSLTSKAEEASSGVAKLQSALADDNSGQAASDALSEEIAQLKAGVAAERVRFSHMTEALEATKGSVEEVSVQPA